MEIIYATNTVPHMLSRKAIARAIRGHFLIDTGLHCLHGSELFDINLPSSEENDLETKHLDSESNTTLEEGSKMFSQLEEKKLYVQRQSFIILY